MSNPALLARPTILALISVPWDVFVGAFLFYALLTLVVLSGADISVRVLAVAYLAAPSAYAVLVVRRLLREAARAGLPDAGDTRLVLH